MSQTLVVGSFTPSVVLALARRSGLLDEAGLTVREVAVPSSPAQFRSLLGGELHLALTSPDNVLAYRFSPRNPLGGLADVTIVGAVDRGMGLGLYGRPGLDDADALRGATVAVDVPNSGFALAMYALTDALGVDRAEYEIVALGSTPTRLRALVAGESDATMLNAGNELLAEAAGCSLLASVADHCSPYLGTVLSIAGTRHLAAAESLTHALHATAREVLAGSLDNEAAEEAAALLDLPAALARQYVDRMKSSTEGLLTDSAVDLAALRTVVDLRSRYLPTKVDGVDVLASALEPSAGLIAGGATRTDAGPARADLPDPPPPADRVRQHFRSLRPAPTAHRERVTRPKAAEGRTMTTKRRAENPRISPVQTPTLRDVASAAGVHAATASRALNPEARRLVNAETARRVLRAAEALGYTPNPIARSLKTSKSKTIGLVLPDLTNPLFPPIVRGIEDVLSPAGFSCLITNTDNDPDREQSHIDLLRSRQVEGLIVATARLKHPLLEGLHEQGVKMVLVNRRTQGLELPSITPDDAAGIELAVKHLAVLGHRRILHIGGPHATSTGVARSRAFKAMVRELGLEEDPALVASCAYWTEDEGAEALRLVLDAGTEFSAIVAGNDLLALGCYDVFAERGIDCPGDVSVVGFNDMPFLDKLRPPLTSVAVPHHQVGVEAARMLLEVIDEPDRPARSVLLPLSLAVRGSTAPPHA